MLDLAFVIKGDKEALRLGLVDVGEGQAGGPDGGGVDDGEKFLGVGDEEGVEELDVAVWCRGWRRRGE